MEEKKSEDPIPKSEIDDAAKLFIADLSFQILKQYFDKYEKSNLKSITRTYKMLPLLQTWARNYMQK